MRKFIVFIIFAVFLTSCSDVLKTTRPDLTTVPQVIPTTESYFNIPVQLNLVEISKTISAQLPVQLYKEDGLDVGSGIKLNILVVRRSGFTFTTEDGNLNMSVPLHISGMANLSGKLCGFCPKIEKSQSFVFDITVNTISKLAIAPDWHLRTQTNTDVHMDNSPHLNVLGFNISLESAMNKIIHAQLPKLDAVINEKINNSYDLKGKVKLFWNQISQPFLVMDSPVNIWMGITPTEFNAAPPVSADTNNLILTIGMKTKIATFIGAKPVFSNPTAIPPVNNDTPTEKLFVTDIPVTIQLSEIAKAARKELAGKTFTIPEPKRDVTINNVDIFGCGNSLIIMVDITSKKIKGKLYIQAKPLYDKSTQLFKVENLKFDSQTNNILMNKAAWLASKFLIADIQKKISYDVGKALREAQAGLDKNLDNMTFNGLLALKANIHDFDVQNIVFDPSYAYLNLKIKGEINVIIK